ncbi:hypothetical protein AA106556_1818 [Neokomagataea tanensis NBRC 106556]|uniref:Uncharacterized protein n=1 Tax=Neokomagataea tanensis NBRC 106556 TaxID=1223519 RepID=A0ABQ0QKX8_9PROT|nr:hypothetical protein AA106556_1818 [Neokomagataea tanensis NBRC 106556]
MAVISRGDLYGQMSSIAAIRPLQGLAGARGSPPEPCVRYGETTGSVPAPEKRRERTFDYLIPLKQAARGAVICA